MPFEENEISKKAFGGTEIAKRSLSKLLDSTLLENFQIVSSRVRDLQQDKIRVFFANDLANDPEVASFKDQNFRNKFHHMVFISNWQYQQYQQILGVPYSSKSSVIESGIEPIDVNEDKFKDDKIHICYTSTPQRGLAILMACFEKLQEKYGESIHLDVFSSFKIYGWDEYDKQFEQLYEKCRNTKGITYMGFQPHDVVINYLANVGHIFSYPCTWPETSCRAMLEAMSAKLLCIHPNIAALPDTSASLNLMYQGDTDNQAHATTHLNILDQAIGIFQSSEQNLQNKLNFNKAYTDARFSIAKVKIQWEMLLTGLLKQNPESSSRGFAQEMFSYKAF